MAFIGRTRLCLPVDVASLSLLALPPRRQREAPAQAQVLALAFWTFHYAKRIAETFFVHK